MPTEFLNNINYIRKKTFSWDLFPNLSVEGYYDFFSQAVFANALKLDDFHSLKPLEDIRAHEKVKGIIIHEVTHWLDHTSTLWGQTNLIDLYNAITSRLSDNPENFQRIIKYVRDVKKINYPQYYNWINPEVLDENGDYEWNGVPWDYKTSIGKMFNSDGSPDDDTPIVYTRFYDKTDGRIICRVPFSIASLTETNSTNNEIVLFTSLYNAFSEIGNYEPNVQQLLFKMIENLYNPHLTVYSLAAHWIADNLEIKHVQDAYMLSSFLSNLCLNLPDIVFEDLKITTELKRLVGQEGWDDKITSYVKNKKDRGVAFFIIAMHGKGYNYEDPEKWIRSTIKSAGLPTLEELNKLADKQFNDIRKNILNGSENQRLLNLLTVGYENFKNRGLLGFDDTVFHSLSKNSKLKLPWILLGDGKAIQISEFLPEDINELAYWLKRASQYSDLISEFVEACL